MTITATGCHLIVSVSFGSQSNAILLLPLDLTNDTRYLTVVIVRTQRERGSTLYSKHLLIRPTTAKSIIVFYSIVV